MIKFALCDDSINILEKVSKMLETIFNENNFNAVVAYSSTNTNDMLNYINKHATNRQKSKKHVPQLLGRIELK